MNKIWIVFVLALFIYLGFFAFNKPDTTSQDHQDYDVGDSLTSEDWRTDGIVLMQHETEGFYGCFGCSSAIESRALCVDPAPVMKLVEETEERHCGQEFNVIYNGETRT